MASFQFLLLLIGLLHGTGTQNNHPFLARAQLVALVSSTISSGMSDGDGLDDDPVQVHFELDWSDKEQDTVPGSAKHDDDSDVASTWDNQRRTLLRPHKRTLENSTFINDQNRTSSSSSPLLCFVQQSVHLLPSHNEETENTTVWMCNLVVWSNKEEGGSNPRIAGSFPLDLQTIPSHIVHQLISAQSEASTNDNNLLLLLRIPQGQIHSSRIWIPDPHQVQVVEWKESGSSLEQVIRHSLSDSTQSAAPTTITPSHRQLRRPQSTGRLKTLMIRVSTNDSTPTFTASELKDFLFDSPVANPKRQLELCSFGQLTLEEFDQDDGDGGGGVLDVSLPNTTVVGAKPNELVNLAEAAANAYYSNRALSNQTTTEGAITNVRASTDLLLFVLPPGTGDWAAYATVNGKQVRNQTKCFRPCE